MKDTCDGIKRGSHGLVVFFLLGRLGFKTSFSLQGPALECLTTFSETKI